MLHRIAYLILGACCLVGSLWAWRTFVAAPDATSFDGLDVAKQKAIWDAEHVTFEIETYVCKPLVTALLARDHETLVSYFLSEFWGSLPQPVPDAQGVSQCGIREESLVATEVSRADDAADFCQQLLAATQLMESPQSGRLRVLKILRSDENPDVWDLEMLLHLQGRDSAGRSVEFESHGAMRCRIPDDAAVRNGQVISRWEIADQTWRGADEPLFTEATAEMGLDRLDFPDNWTLPVELVREYSAQHAVGDFDGDGDLDLASATADGDCFVHRREGGRFVDVSAELGIVPETNLELRSYLAHWIDVDSDGFDDLLLGSRLYRNLSGGRFELFPDNAGVQIKFNPMGVTVADYDVDGHPDIYILYQHKQQRDRSGTPAWVGEDESGETNQLWRNLGNGQFKNTTDTAGACGGARHSFAAAWHHANDDLLPDLYIANDFGGNSLLMNRGDGGFEDVSQAAGVADFATSMGVVTGDVNEDGRADIYVANMFSKMGRRIIAQVDEGDYPSGVYDGLLGSCAGNRLYSPQEGTYAESSEQLGINAVGWAYAPALLDVDGDGDLDIYATCGFMSFDRRKPDG